MFNRMPILVLSLSVVLSAPTLQRGVLAADDEVFAPMSVEEARAQTLEWASGQGLKDRALIDSIGKLWAPGNSQKRPAELHKLAVKTFALAKPAVADLLKQCQFGTLAAPTSPLLETEVGDDYFSNNLLAYVGTFLTQAEFFDEGLTLFEKTKPQQLVDPASFFFHKAVCEHRLLKAKEGLATLKQLLENTTDVPVRYSTVAELMKADLEKLKEKSLDEVSRMMSDVERRLKLRGARLHAQSLQAFNDHRAGDGIFLVPTSRPFISSELSVSSMLKAASASKKFDSYFDTPTLAQPTKPTARTAPIIDLKWNILSPRDRAPAGDLSRAGCRDKLCHQEITFSNLNALMTQQCISY